MRRLVKVLGGDQENKKRMGGGGREQCIRGRDEDGDHGQKETEEGLGRD